MDLGYAYLGVDGHSHKQNEKEILFNVLSSFQIKSVEKFEHEEREVWHIKLEYGVTYQMMLKHNYNKKTHKKGTAE